VIGGTKKDMVYLHVFFYLFFYKLKNFSSYVLAYSVVEKGVIIFVKRDLDKSQRQNFT